MAWRIGVDTGGTFTDVVAYCSETGVWVEKKIWSERGEPGKSLQTALQSLGLDNDQIETLVYGTTVVTNALIEDATARVALLTTKGFRDVLQIARQRRDALFDLKRVHRDPPIVPQERCYEVDERCDVNGLITKTISPGAVTGLIERLRDQCDAVAVSFLHAYANSANEVEVARLVRAVFEHVSVSHELSPEAREYERTLVTALNAALLPMMTRFLASLTSTGVSKERLNLFHSAGGMVSPDTASKFPLLLAKSGPAAGVEAASTVARSLRLPLAITLDMGGTSTDCSLLVDGRAALQMDASIGRYRIRQPMVAVESVGAGGGSIVRLTDVGLQVGPDSAGADPGPACYQRGGMLPTITDAAAIVGYFGNEHHANRPLAIDRESAVRSFSDIARYVNRSVEETASGAIRVANAIAARAIKRITMGRGIDARSCSLIAFGGAGPMFACLLAGDLGIRRVVVPPKSSALSAFGCLSAEPSFTRQRTIRLTEQNCNSSAIDGMLSALEQSVFHELQGKDAPSYGVHTESVALMRYAGQSYEIEVPLARPVAREFLTQTFREKHQETYGFCLDEPWECVALRVTAKGSAGTNGSIRIGAAQDDQTPAGRTRAYFSNRGWCEMAEYGRAAVANCDRISGPAVIIDEWSTILIAPNWTARADNAGHINIEHQSE